MAQKKRKLSKKEQKAVNKRGIFENSNFRPVQNQPEDIKEKKKVYIPEVIGVKDFAEISGIPVTEVISHLIKNGVLANINENIDFETAEIIGDDLGLEVISKKKDETESIEAERETISSDKNLPFRPPVVTIMGHVDHGKTTLLDTIRKEHVASGESGGITQHISAYQIEVSDKSSKKKRPITFIDTPGHSAFSAMRSHGASIADIVVLIVAADDGVMPQTIEVIEQAKIHNVPIIVAINKVDLPNADTMKTKQQLSEHGIITEEWGGKTVVVELSAKTGKGVEELLEMILLKADVMELRADPQSPATGIVIESHIHRGAGALAVVLIENGTLNLSDCVTIGAVCGKIRILEDFTGKGIISAGPSMPVRVAGLHSLPDFGERLVSFESEKEARMAAKRFEERNFTRRYAAKSIKENDDKIKVLNLIIKSDVAGSLEAIKKMLSEITHPELQIKIVSEGVGAVSESDVAMAQATKAVIMAFRISTLISAKKIIEKEKLTILEYSVIYELIDDVKRILEEMLSPIVHEIETGSGEILAEFRNDKKATVIGFRVNSGQFDKGMKVKIISGKDEIWRGEILSLRREKEQVSSVPVSVEAGVCLAPGAKYNIGDKIVAFRIEEEKQKL
ncbi:MAG: translation initiation factor IF-2 [Candidatus Berkelbacteria bacterium Athens1014_28]|uniref:Translation initiation factor IF-2 n=1 Tax=Candidatus Berkelbacteria bacterium Athens1014_28 TaxID=2017145 RepID=A0A554LN51_9BACT|nr:MAG: translation initiation factor IF-2 [Candidatus Berkelbacteria bacterium Athens1014_28]